MGLYDKLKNTGHRSITTTMNILSPVTLAFLFILLLLPWRKVEKGRVG
ncbi:hypothetical protein [Geosporobacter subterraneus]|nr:hypothetical protein [Geosporobacter subterraneus]